MMTQHDALRTELISSHQSCSKIHQVETSQILFDIQSFHDVSRLKCRFQSPSRGYGHFSMYGQNQSPVLKVYRST